MSMANRIHRHIGLGILAFLLATLVVWGAPPQTMRYQARLTDDAGVPLTGTSTALVFGIYDAASGGSPLWTESPAPVDLSQTNGVVDLVLGETTPIPASVFSGADRWLQVTVDGSVLSPRQKLASVPFALVADSVDGMDSTDFLDTSSTPQTKAGQLTVSPGGSYGVEAYGSVAGGYFGDTDDSGYARIADEHRGIIAYGNNTGGYFEDLDSTGYAYVAYGDRGIEARGSEMGAYFKDTSDTSHAFIAYGTRGIWSYGTDAGGYLEDTDSSGRAWVAYGDYGIQANGNAAGGYFLDADQSGYAYVGYEDRGIAAYGNTSGGYFADLDHSGLAWVGYGDRGIEAHGNEAGGYFEALVLTGYAYAGYGDTGIAGYGNAEGGYFEDIDDVTYMNAAIGTSSTAGNGTKDFVQNHPYDPGLVIHYSSLEGDEVGTYTRGTARLAGGEARVPLGETFRWVTNPDLGLTAHLTSRGAPADLYVASLSTSELVVRSRSAADAAFDYLVCGLRIGFEEVSLLREKAQEAPIPSMASHQDLYVRRPDLQRLNALGRFTGMRTAMGETAPLDLGASQALRDAIMVFDPEQRLEVAADRRSPRLEDPGKTLAARTDTTSETARSAVTPPEAPGGTGIAPVAPPAPLHQAPTAGEASHVSVSRPVTAGDVLVVDPERPGLMKLGSEAADPTVVGIAAGASREGEVESRVPVALSGIVPCRVDAGYGAVRPGDLLTVSPTPGHAMRSDDPRPGTIVGKALEPLDEGTGLIQVLVLLH